MIKDRKALICLSLFLIVSTSSHTAHVVAAGLKGTYNALPTDLQLYSPLHGAVIANNGLLTTLYNEVNTLGDLTRVMFNELNGQIRCTASPIHPVTTLSPLLVKQLIEQISHGKPCIELLPSEIILPDPSNPSKQSNLNEFGKEWWRRYQEQSTGHAQDFKRLGKRFLALVDNAYSENKEFVRYLLLAFAYLKSPDAQTVQTFFQLFYPSLKKDCFTEENFKEFEHYFQTVPLTPEQAQQHVEQLVFFLLRRKEGDLHFLKPRLQHIKEGQERIALCMEGTVQTIINCILYDPITRQLTTSFLPPTIHLNPHFLSFIENHKNPHLQDYYSRTLPDWIRLLSHIPHVTYRHKDKEIKSTTHNLLMVLNYLFGTNARSYKELSHLLSGAQRRILLEEIFDTTEESSDEDTFLDASDTESDKKSNEPSSRRGSASVFPFPPSAPLQGSSQRSSISNDGQRVQHTRQTSIVSSVSSSPTPNDHEKQNLMLTISTAQESCILEIEIQNDLHIGCNFATSYSRVPTLIELETILLVESYIKHNLLALFNVDWYETIQHLFHTHTLSSAQDFIDFFTKYRITPSQLAALAQEDNHLLELFINQGRADIVQAFIDYGVNITTFPGASNDHTPLRSSFLSPQNVAVEANIPHLLIKHGAALTPEEINHQTEEQGKKQDNFFHKVFATEHHQAIELLLELGADPNIPNERGTIPLQQAAWANDLPLVELLLQYHGDYVGADPNIPLNPCNVPLLALIDPNNLALVELLLRYGADPQTTSSSGTPLLEVATWNNNLPLTELLLRYGANPNTCTLTQTPVLLSVIRQNNLPLTELLLHYGANPNTSNSAGIPLLLCALRENNLPLAELLLAHGANPNIVDTEGTPLLINVIKQGNGITNKSARPAMVSLLLKYGADPSLANAKGKNAWRYAQSIPFLEELIQQTLQEIKKAEGLIPEFERLGAIEHS